MWPSLWAEGMSLAVALLCMIEINFYITFVMSALEGLLYLTSRGLH
jgi:hypothetical protein